MSESALNSSVLVLNRSLVAVDLTTARRAFCLVCKAAAEIVDVSDGRFDFYGFQSWRELSELKRQSGLALDHEDWVSTVSCCIQVPRIIRLQFYDRFPQMHVTLNRRNLFARDENRCQYCGRRHRTTELSIDHVVPLSIGGKTEWTNVVCACTDCNKRKGGRTPAQAFMRLIRRPVQPRHNPLIRLQIRLRKYISWKHFLAEAYWSVALE